MQECNNVGRGENGAVVEFTVLLGENEFAVRIEDGEAGNARRRLQRDAVVVGEIEVAIALVTDTDVHDMKVGVDERSDGLRVERRIENVAVVAPVPAEDEDHALVVFRSGS